MYLFTLSPSFKIVIGSSINDVTVLGRVDQQFNNNRSFLKAWRWVNIFFKIAWRYLWTTPHSKIICNFWVEKRPSGWVTNLLAQNKPFCSRTEQNKCKCRDKIFTDKIQALFGFEWPRHSWTLNLKQVLEKFRCRPEIDQMFLTI